VRIDSPDDTTPVLQLEGTAEKDGVSKPFTGRVTIGKDRIVTSMDATQAGAAPICKQRIVSPIPTFVRLQKTGTLLLRIHPHRLFTNVDFSSLPPSGDKFAFTNAASLKDQASVNLYNNLGAATGSDDPLYSFEWVP